MSPISLQRQQVISDTIRYYNEDIGTIIDGAAWTLDGATGVADKTYTNAPSDGHWYVRQFDKYLQNHVHDTSKSLTKHVADAITHVSNQFDEFTPNKSIDKVAEPSATGAIVRWVDGVLEYYVLCDSTFIILENSDMESIETDKRIEYLEKSTREEMYQLKQQGLTLEEARQQLMPTLRKNRRQKNTPDGYWVLSFDPKAATKGITGQYNLTAETTIYLFTDGFARLVEIYDAYSDWETAISAVQHEGIESAIDEIRKIEQMDPDGDEHLRLKQSDDITAVKLTLMTD